MKSVIFDLYGTLVDIHTDEDSLSFWDKVTLLFSNNGAYYQADELKNEYKKICAIKYEEKRNIGVLHPDFKIEEVFIKLFENKNVSITTKKALMIASKFRKLSTDYIKLFPNIENMLINLKNKGYHLFLLTNAQRAFTIPELKRLRIINYFDDIIISSDYGMSKPDTNFFNIIINKYHLNNKNSIYIGNDYLSDVKGSVDANLECIYIKTPQSRFEEDIILTPYQISDMNFYELENLIINILESLEE